MAFDVKKAVEGKTKEDLQKLMEWGLKKRDSMSKGKNMTMPGPGPGGGQSAKPPIPGKVEDSIGRIGQAIGAQKSDIENHVNEHIREVKEYLASR